MICEKIKDQTGPLIRRELPGEERLLMLEHLRQCPDCREEYLLQLKLFYELDKKQVFADAAQPDSDLFMKQLNTRMRMAGKTRRFNNRWLALLAAAVLIAFTVLLTQYFNPFEGSPVRPVAERETDLHQLLENEDWPMIMAVLNDSGRLNAQANKAIPVKLLIEKLVVLNNHGLRFISLDDFPVLAVPASGDTNRQAGTANNRDQLSVRKIIKNLKYYKRQNPQITVDELSSLINHPSLRRVQT